MVKKISIFVLAISAALVMPQTAHANPECAVNAPNIGCIGNFDPAPPSNGGGGGGRLIVFLSQPLWP
jgi:hypothetical protein